MGYHKAYIGNGGRIDEFKDTKFGGTASVSKLTDSNGEELCGNAHATIHGNGHINIHGLYGGIPGIQNAAAQHVSNSNEGGSGK